MRVEASPLEKEVYLGGKYSPASMVKSGIDDTMDSNHVLLDAFKIQENVKMHMQLLD